MKKLISLKAAFLALAAFVLVGFTTSIGAKADDEKYTPVKNEDATWTYDAVTDTLNVKSASTGAIYVYSTKTSEPETLKKAAATIKKLDNTTGASIYFVKSGSKKADISIALNKAAYLLLSYDAPSTKTGKEATATITINPSAVKSGKLTFNYAKVVSVGSITAADFVAPSLVLADDGKTVIAADGDKWAPAGEEITVSSTTPIVASLEYSLDNQATWKVLSALTAKEIYEQSVAAKPNKFYWRVKGTGSSSAAGKAGYRPSKVFTTTIAKQPKAPSVKLDVKKNVLTVKNGLDYQIVASGAAVNYALASWTTILPYNKSESASATAEKATDTFVVVPKFTEDDATAKANFTNKKVTGIAVQTILSTSGISTAGGFDVYYRKSATKSAPASAAGNTGVVSTPAAAPTFTVAATAGGLKLKLTASEAAQANKQTTFEYIIVKKDDLAKADLASVNWKKFDSNKTIIKYNAKNDRYMVGEDKADASVIEAGDYILIRSQAIAYNKTKQPIPVLASEYLQVTIASVDEDAKAVSAVEPSKK